MASCLCIYSISLALSVIFEKISSELRSTGCTSGRTSSQTFCQLRVFLPFQCQQKSLLSLPVVPQNGSTDESSSSAHLFIYYYFLLHLFKIFSHVMHFHVMCMTVTCFWSCDHQKVKTLTQLLKTLQQTSSPSPGSFCLLGGCKRKTQRGKQIGVLCRTRTRHSKIRLPTILLVKTQSLRNKLDDLRSQIYYKRATRNCFFCLHRNMARAIHHQLCCYSRQLQKSAP